MAKYPKKSKSKPRSKTRPKKKSTPEFWIPQYTDFRGTEASTEALRDYCSSTHGPLEFQRAESQPGIGPLPPQAPLAPIVSKQIQLDSWKPCPSLEPPTGTMLNPAEYNVRHTIEDVEEVIPASLGEWIEYFHYPETLVPATTRWQRFKDWFRYTFVD